MRARLLLLLLLLPRIAAAQAPTAAEVDSVLGTLVETHGVSGMEAPVRDVVRRFLPSWARTETDTAGNLWLTVGQGEPTVVFVAHLDEIGFTDRDHGAAPAPG